MTFGAAYLLLGALWIGTSAAGGAFLALLARRGHPALSFRRLWLFYACLLAFAVGAFSAVAIL